MDGQLIFNFSSIQALKTQAPKNGRLIFWFCFQNTMVVSYFQDGLGHTSKDKPPSSSGNLLLIGLLSFGQKSALERLFDEGLGVSNALWQCLDAGIVFQIGTSLMKLRYE